MLCDWSCYWEGVYMSFGEFPWQEVLISFFSIIGGYFTGRYRKVSKKDY